MALEIFAIVMFLCILVIFLELDKVPGNRRKDLPPGTQVALRRRPDLLTYIFQGHQLGHSLAIFTNCQRPGRISSMTFHQR